MLFSNEVGDISKSRESVSLVFVSLKRSRNEIASDLVHLQSVIGLFNQSR